MKAMKRVSFVLCFFLLTFSFFISYGFCQTKPIELNYSIFYPATHKMAVLATEWSKEVEKRTNGGVKITMFYGGTLTPADKCYEGVVNGIADIGWSVFGYSRGRFPLTEIADMPLGAKNSPVPTRLANEYYKKFRPKELDDVKVIYLICTGPSILHTIKPVTKLEDLKGMKIRSGGLTAKVVAALGAAPVAMPIGEAYDALSKGVAEGTILPMEAMEGWRLGEVVKYSIENYGSAPPGGQYVVMNKDKWNAMSPDVQKIVEKINEEWIEKTGRAFDEIDKSGRDYVQKLGNKIIPLSKEEDQRWTRAVRPILDQYVKDVKAKGLPGDEVLRFWLDYIGKNR